MPVIVPPEPQIWQGDIFADVPWSVIRRQEFVQKTGDDRFSLTSPPVSGNRGWLVTQSGRDLGMLLSHECVVDKRGSAPLTLGRVLPITKFRDEQSREYIRRGQNYQTFHLPAVPSLIPESYVDFRFVASIDPELFNQFMRVSSLTVEGRDSLRHQLILYLTRTEPATGPIQLSLRPSETQNP